MSFLVIKPNSVEIDHEPLNLKLMQSLVEGRIEFIREQFSDPTIDLICNDEFLSNDSPLTGATQEQIFLHGTILAVGVNLETGETVGLTEEQIEVVRQELEVIDDLGFLHPASKFLQN